MPDEKKIKENLKELDDATLDKVAGGTNQSEALKELEDTVSKKSQMPHYPPSV